MAVTSERDDALALRDAARAALHAGRSDEARARFAEASRFSDQVLPVTDAVRLAVAGEHADAWFEHWHDVEKAFEIARTAYDDAVAAIDGTAGDQYREAVRELSRLRDRLTFWAFTMATS